VEWTLYFKNTGDKDTPILADIQALDIRLERKPGPDPAAGFLLHHNAGSLTEPSDYQPFETVLGPGTDLRITGQRGRPTASDLCYFNLETAADEGLIIALGWPGQIATRFLNDRERRLRIAAGQESTRFKLLPGEESARRSWPFCPGREKTGFAPRTSGAGGSSPTTSGAPVASCRRSSGAAGPERVSWTSPPKRS